MKPSDFFFGAMEFFAVLLPGAVLAYLLAPWAAVLFGPLLPALNSEAERWGALAVASYFLGHLLHHVGGFLDQGYDRGFAAQKRRFGDDTLTAEAKKLVRDDLGTLPDDVSVFQWAGAWVRAHNAEAGAELERAGGESKFFRSLCLVGGAAALLFLAQGQATPLLLALALTAFSYRRFCSRRWESTQRTYQYFVLLRREAARVPAR